MPIGESIINYDKIETNVTSGHWDLGTITVDPGTFDWHQSNWQPTITGTGSIDFSIDEHDSVRNIWYPITVNDISLSGDILCVPDEDEPAECYSEDLEKFLDGYNIVDVGEGGEMTGGDPQ